MLCHSNHIKTLLDIMWQSFCDIHSEDRLEQFRQETGSLVDPFVSGELVFGKANRPERFMS